MTDKPVRIIRHSIIADCGSFEVRYSDGRPSVYIYWEDNPGRRLRPETLTQDQARELAQETARRG